MKDLLRASQPTRRRPIDHFDRDGYDTRHWRECAEPEQNHYDQHSDDLPKIEAVDGFTVQYCDEHDPSHGKSEQE